MFTLLVCALVITRVHVYDYDYVIYRCREREGEMLYICV